MPKRKKTHLTSQKGRNARGRPKDSVPYNVLPCSKVLKVAKRKKTRLTSRKGRTANGYSTRRVTVPKLNKKVTVEAQEYPEDQSGSTLASEPGCSTSTTDFTGYDTNVKIFAEPIQIAPQLALASREPYLTVEAQEYPEDQSGSTLASETGHSTTDCTDHGTDVKIFADPIQTAPQLALEIREPYQITPLATRRSGRQTRTKKENNVPKPRPKSANPPVAEMVRTAITVLRQRGGASLHAIKKFVSVNYEIEMEKVTPYIKQYLRCAVACGSIIQKNGKGVARSFRLARGASGSFRVVSTAKATKATSVGNKEKGTMTTNQIPLVSEVSSTESSMSVSSSVIKEIESIIVKAEPVDSGTEHEEIQLPDVIDPGAEHEEIDQPNFVQELLLMNGVHEDSDCEDLIYFAELDVENTRKCLENTKLIVKDEETQLDWHLHQYMTLRHLFQPKKKLKSKEPTQTELLSISQLSALLANNPEGNNKFLKTTKKYIKKKTTKLKKEQVFETESEKSPNFDSEEEDIDMLKSKPGVYIKEEIVEEMHDLIIPKSEVYSDEEPEKETEKPVQKITRPSTGKKRGRKPKRKYYPRKPQNV